MRSLAALMLVVVVRTCPGHHGGGSNPGPAAPGGLSAAPANAQVALNWNAVTGASGYEVFRSVAGAAAALAGTSMTASFTDSTVKNGTTYTYTVRAVNASGESADSAAVTAQPFRAVCVADIQGDRITVLDAETPDAAPLTRFGSATGISSRLVAVDGAHGEVFAANALFNTVTVHAENAQGNAPPLRAFTVNGVQEIAYDADDARIIAGDFETLQTFERTASGAAVPVRTLNVPDGHFFAEIALSGAAHGDRLFVLDAIDRSSFLVYHRTDSGNAAPIAAFSSSAIDPFTIGAIAYDPAADELLVSAASGGQSAILAFPAASNGPTAPTRILRDAEGIALPSGLSVDPVHGVLYVVNVTGTVFTFPSDFAPDATLTPGKLTGPDTQLEFGSASIAVDLLAGKSVVLNNNHLLVFDAAATGDAAPLSEVTPISSGVEQPAGLAFDKAHGEIFVGNGGAAPFIAAFGLSPHAASLSRTLPVTTATLAEVAVAADSLHGELFVAAGLPQIAIYDRTANGSAAPLRVIGGDQTLLGFPGAVGFDTANDAVVVMDGAAIRRYARSFSDGNEAPLSSIEGPDTNLDLPQSIYVDNANGEIYVATNDGVVVFPLTANGDVAPTRFLQMDTFAMDMFVDAASDELFVISFDGLNVYSRTASGTDQPLRQAADVFAQQLADPVRMGICN